MLKKLLITDLESTCYERGTEPKDFFSEIIEIGSTLFNIETMERENEYNTLVKPVLFPVSPFCTRLTTLTQGDVNNGISASQAMQGYRNLFGEGIVLASWGEYDARQIWRVCKRFNLKYPFDNRHINLKEAFAKFYGLAPNRRGKLGVGMEKALQILGFPLDGTHHRGIDDARNIEKITIKMIQDGWKPEDSIYTPEIFSRK